MVPPRSLCLVCKKSQSKLSDAPLRRYSCLSFENVFKSSHLSSWKAQSNLETVWSRSHVAEQRGSEDGVAWLGPGSNNSMPFCCRQVNNTRASLTLLHCDARRQPVKCFMRCFQKRQHLPTICCAQSMRDCLDRWKRKGLKLPFRDLETATQIPHPNAPAALDIRNNLET